ncbi:V-type proton ATPase subunit G 1 isoform X1 [Callorhinus ursinus]|uniref:V-type proton ATPase subunit G 1 isoform X1 n=1 Tax=Callorhinus ursinus TaxID=34884 RepID=UPI001015E00D|nr:V-type proton ATPase subunit G 1 isoform X1 [Eumetopias jubatus]
MASQSQGIQQLLQAEKRAAEKVSEARKRKNRRLKQAKEEAQAEIEQYRLQREKEFKAKEAAGSPSPHHSLRGLSVCTVPAWGPSHPPSQRPGPAAPRAEALSSVLPLAGLPSLAWLWDPMAAAAPKWRRRPRRR